MTVINSRRSLCDMGGQHMLWARRHSKFTHTEIKLLDQPVDSDIIYQPLFDLIFRIHQKLNKRCSLCINLTMRHVRVTIVGAEILSITYSERVFVAVVIQHVTPTLRSIWSPTACPALFFNIRPISEMARF
jgi:hypothetical protein